MIPGQIAAFCIDLLAFCGVLQRFGVILLRSAPFGGSFSREGAHSLENERSALIMRQIAALCIDFWSFCCVLH